MVYDGQKKMKLTFKIWLLIIVLALSLLSIFGFPPTFTQKGVLITSVDANSTAYEQGLRQGQVITQIDGQTIGNLDDFSNAWKIILLPERFSESKP